MDVYIPFREHGILPHAGGWLDQDYWLTEALLDLDYRVAWCMQNSQKRANLPKARDIFAERRKRFQS